MFRRVTKLSAALAAPSSVTSAIVDDVQNREAARSPRVQISARYVWMHRKSVMRLLSAQNASHPRQH
jgi:FixJ family two-component response regulator